MNLTGYKKLDTYIMMVRKGIPKPYCKWQHKLVDQVEKIFSEEDIYVDEEQLEKYMAFQKYFPYKLLPWENSCLHSLCARTAGTGNSDSHICSLT